MYVAAHTNEKKKLEHNLSVFQTFMKIAIPIRSGNFEPSQ